MQCGSVARIQMTMYSSRGALRAIALGCDRFSPLNYERPLRLHMHRLIHTRIPTFVHLHSRQLSLYYPTQEKRAPSQSASAPTAEETANADTKLIQELTQLATQSGKSKLVHCSSYPAPGIPGLEIQRWKLNEYKYSVVPSPFPTLARGLFSRKVSQAEKNKEEYKIVARGYDKFFNIGEVPWTSVSGSFTSYVYRSMLTKDWSSGPPSRSIPSHHTP